MLKKSIKRIMSCVAIATMGLSLQCTPASAKLLDLTQKSLSVPAINKNTLEDYSSFKVTNGYGVVGKAGVVLTKGASADINVNLSVTCVTADDLAEFVSNNKKSFTTEQYNQITQNVKNSKGQSAATLLKGILGLKFGNNATNAWGTYNNANGTQVNASDDENKEFLKSLHDLTQHTYQLNGRITAVGLSRTPTIAYCFIEVSRIQFQDGTTLKVVNTTANVGDSTGSTSNISGASNNGPLILNEI